MKFLSPLVLAILLAEPSWALVSSYSSTFIPRSRIASSQNLKLVAEHERSHSLSMKVLELSKLGKGLATVFAAAAIMAGGVHDAEAARSGGRVGGRQFSAPRSAPAPRASSRSYQSAPAITSYRSTTTLMPVPMPIISPFGFGGGYYGGGYGLGLMGPNLVDIVVLGGVAYAATQFLRSSSPMSGGNWGSIDGDDSSLGKGVSIIKIQVALDCKDRSRSGFLGQLKAIADRAETDSRGGLSTATSEVCLALVRNSRDWNAAASNFEYFLPRNAEKAESLFNSYAINERSKVERETMARFDGETLSELRQSTGTRLEDLGKPTQAVVTVVLALRGESLRNFQIERSINNVSTLKSVLSKLAGDCVTDNGDNVLAAELLWTPEEPWESLDRQDILADFPELMDL